MKTENIPALLMDNVTTVGVEFTESFKTYTFKTNLDLEVGDWILVPSKNSGYEPKIVKVTEVHDEPILHDQYEYKWVISKVDFDNYYDLIDQEKKIAEYLAQAEAKRVRATALDVVAAHLGMPLEDLRKDISQIGEDK